MIRDDGARSGNAVLWHRFTTRIGSICVAATHDGLARVAPDADPRSFKEELSETWPDRPIVRDPRALASAERQLREYVHGEREAFDLPLDFSGLSGFDRTVLRAVTEVPYGEVVSYGELARRVGRPRAARPVGGALGRNPLPLVVPCHRVVRSDGRLGGYTGGVDRKQWLLRLEGAAPVGSRATGP